MTSGSPRLAPENDGSNYIRRPCLEPFQSLTFLAAARGRLKHKTSPRRVPSWTRVPVRSAASHHGYRPQHNSIICHMHSQISSYKTKLCQNSPSFVSQNLSLFHFQYLFHSLSKSLLSFLSTFKKAIPLNFASRITTKTKTGLTGTPVPTRLMYCVSRSLSASSASGSNRGPV